MKSQWIYKVFSAVLIGLLALTFLPEGTSPALANNDSSPPLVVASINVGPQISPLTYGTASSTSFIVTVNRTGGAFMNVGLSISSGLPAGATYTFTPATVSCTGGCSSITSTLTINTAATTPAVTASSFTVANNSNAVTGTGSLTIDRRSLTITANNASKTYGQTLTFAGTEFTTTGLVNGNTVTSITLVSSGAPATATVAGSPYPIVPSGAVGTGLANYNITYVNGNLTVNAKALTITADNQSKIYGDIFAFSGSEFSAVGLVNSDSVTSVTLASVGAAATSTVSGSPYPIVPSDAIGTGLNNYAITYVNGGMIVNPANLLITASSDTMVYGGTVPTITPSYNGLQAGDTQPATPPICSTTATSSSSVAGSPYSSSCSGAVDSNYTISYANGTVTITPADLLITASSDTMVYGGSVPIITPIYTGLQAGDTQTDIPPTCSTVATSTSSVAGSPYISSCGGAVDSNYTITYATGIVSVTPADLLITASSDTMVYGGSVPIITPIYSGLQAGDTQTDTPASCSTVATSTSSVAGSPYTSSCSGAVDSNYTITYATGTVTITPRDASVTPNAASKTYGDADPAFSGTLAGFLPADGVTATYNRTAGETVAGNPYIISATLSPVGVLSNYNIAYNTADFNITQRAASVTPNAGSKTYGDADPVLTGILTGFLPADGVTATYTRALGETVAGNPYIINATLNPAGVLGNYNITYNTANFTITPRAASVTPNPASKTYGDADPAFSGTLAGFLPADGVTATYNRTAGETVAGSPYTISAILVPAGVLGNYTITYNTANFTIGTASATVSLSNLTHTYDGTPKSATVTTTPNGLPFSITYDGSPTAPTNAGSYAVVATITDPNYSGSANDTLVINPANVTASIVASNKVYNGLTNASFTCSLSGVIGTDAVNCAGGTANFADKNVGVGKTVTATGLGLSGAQAGNYQLSSSTANGTANITERDLNVTATGINKVYDGNTNATVTLNDDRVGGDVLTVDYTSASFADPNVGVNIPVSVTGISISGGADAGNYNLVNTSTTTNADITIDSQTINVTTSAPANAVNGSSFDVVATATSGLPVTITTSGSCSGGDTDGGATITMTSGTGTCSVFYNQAGNANYSAAPQVQEDVTATDSPVFTSTDNTTFDFGFSGNFNITATGNPSTMSITMTGEPAGITITDNGDGTASLNYDGTTSPGLYSIIFTANNGVAPNGIQNFTLTIRNGPAVSTLNSSPDTGNGSVSENENISTTLGITQFTVEFDRDVYDDSTNTTNFDDDVTNPANYMLVRSATGTFGTTSCSSGIGSPDVAISVDSVTYSNGGGSGPFVATLNVNSGLPLNVAVFYRLFVCGTTSIVDATNPLLALAGNGVIAGTDFTRNFRMTSPAAGGGAGGGGGGGGNPTTLATTLSGFLIPVTGFTPSQVTQLPAQPVEKEYAKSELTLKIPSLGMNLPIVGIKLEENGWDVTWLGNNAGYLEGSAYPTWNGNSILTSHFTDPNGKPGPFAYINELAQGDKVYVHNNGFVYVYEVRQSQLVLPTSINILFKSEDDAWLTLVTCENYNEKADKFTHRRIVRAVLISIIPEK